MDIERINYLAKKSKNGGLSESEKEEQKKLREEYIKNFRNNFVSQLENTYILDEKGNKTKLKKKD